MEKREGKANPVFCTVFKDGTFDNNSININICIISVENAKCSRNSIIIIIRWGWGAEQSKKLISH